MKLEEYIRGVLANKLIPLIKKDKCEICGSKENLEVHHLKLFSEIVTESLKELNLDYKNIKEYTSDELNLVTDVILGKHLRIEYLTLCHKCHKQIHAETWKEVCVNDKHRQYYKKLKLIKEQQEKNGKIINNNQLKKYLKRMVDKKLFKDDRIRLIEQINLKDDRYRLQKSITQLNNYFKKNKIKYVIESKRKSVREGNKVNKEFYWIVEKLN